MLADSLSRSVGEVAVVEDEEDEQVLEQLSCKHDKKELKIVQIILTANSSTGLKESLEFNKNS